MRQHRASPSRAALWSQAFPGAQRRPTFLVACAVLFVPATFLDSFVVSPFRMFDNPATVLGLLMAGGFAVRRLSKMRFSKGPAGLALLYLAGATAAWFVVASSGGGYTRDFPAYFQHAQAIILFLIFLDTCRDRRALMGVAIAMYISCSLMSVLANVGLASGLIGSQAYGRAGVGALNLNQQAFLYALCLIGFFGWCLVRWPRFGWREWAMAVCSASMFVAAVRTGSRGGLVMLLFGLTLALFFFLRGKRAPAYVTLVPLVLAGVLGTVVTSDVVQARYARTLQGDTGMRMELTESGWRMFLQKPGFGWGADYVEEMGDFVGLGRRISAHNTYFQVLLSFGLAGFLPWSILVVFVGWRLWRWRRHPVVTIGLVLYLSTLVFSLVGNNAYNKVFWILLALLSVLPEMVRITAPDPARILYQSAVSPWRSANRVSVLDGRYPVPPPMSSLSRTWQVVREPPEGRTLR